jgi:hypothetical protein
VYTRFQLHGGLTMRIARFRLEATIRWDNRASRLTDSGGGMVRPGSRLCRLMDGGDGTALSGYNSKLVDVRPVTPPLGHALSQTVLKTAGGTIRRSSPQSGLA